MEEEISILVIDDERGIREGCRRALTPLGYDVTVAETGATGLRKLREGTFAANALKWGVAGLNIDGRGWGRTQFLSIATRLGMT